MAQLANILITSVILIQTLSQVPTIPGLESSCPSGLDEFGSYCYMEVEATSFPYDCPYVSTNAYDGQPIASKFNESLWRNVKRNEIYGYFEYLDLDDNYGYLFSTMVPNYDYENCMISQMTRSCSNKSKGLCVYRHNDKRYCDAYNNICDTGNNCHCRSIEARYLCQATCAGVIDEECSMCEQKFQQYERPKIQISFDQIDSIIVDVSNPLKLIDLNYGWPIYCFSDVYVPERHLTKYRYSASEITMLQEKTTYKLKIRSLAMGTYWCEGFSLPELEKVESNKVMTGLKSAYGLNFVLNVSFADFTLLYYDVHTLPIVRLENIISKAKYQLIRAVEIAPLYENRDSVDLILHLTTLPSITDSDDQYWELSNELRQCEAIGLINCKLAYSDLCLPDTTNTIADLVEASWPKTYLGQQTAPMEILLQEDGLPITRSCLGSFMKGAYWSDVVGNVSNRMGSDITQDLTDLIASNKTAEEINQALSIVISSAQNVIAYDVYLIARIFERVAQSGNIFDREVFTQNLNGVMKIDSEVLQVAQSVLNATDAILYNFDVALGALTRNKTITTKHVVAQVVSLNVFGGARGFAIYEIDGELQIRNLSDVTSLDDVDFDHLKFATFIPPALLNQILAQNREPNLVAAAYLNDALFRSKDNFGVGAASLVLSIFVPGFIGVNLTEEIPIIFDANYDIGADVYCGFWKYGFDDMQVAIRGRWQKEQTPNLHSNFKLCTATHMTHFALLAAAPKDAVLDLISLIGCVLSVLGVGGIMITAAAFKAWRDNTATKILLCFSVTILMQMVVIFLWNIEAGKWCSIVLVGVHYSIISQFSWMLIIGYLQYRKFVQVLVNEPTYLLVSSYIIGWLVPIIPITITYFLDQNLYSNHNYCFMSRFGLYFGLFLPVACVITINLIIFILIFASLSCKKTTQAYGDKQNLVVLKLKLSVILFFLLGFSWVFGFLAHLFESLVLSYLFCITSTTQGFVLYIYFVLLNKVTRKFWLKKFIYCRTRVRRPYNTRKISVTSYPRATKTSE